MTRLAPASGVVFVALTVAGLALQAILVGGVEDESRAEVVARDDLDRTNRSCRVFLRPNRSRVETPRAESHDP
jgi:hypothetical protein